MLIQAALSDFPSFDRDSSGRMRGILSGTTLALIQMPLQKPRQSLPMSSGAFIGKLCWGRIGEVLLLSFSVFY